MKLRKNNNYYLNWPVEIDVGKPNPSRQANAWGTMYIQMGTLVKLLDYADDWVRIRVIIPHSPVSFTLKTHASVLTDEPFPTKTPEG